MLHYGFHTHVCVMLPSPGAASVTWFRSLHLTRRNMKRPLVLGNSPTTYSTLEVFAHLKITLRLETRRVLRALVDQVCHVPELQIEVGRRV
jgi:hypothetical protein